MTRTLDAVLLSWPFDPWIIVPLLLTGFIYLRGWLFLRRRHARWTGWRLAAFPGGLLAIFLALGSPIETFSGLLLHIHMVQHLLLMMVAPPLLWLGEPLVPLLRGLPHAIRSAWIGPLFRWPPLRWLFRVLTHPVAAWLLFVAATWLWHAPQAYETALQYPPWHYLEHACFLGSALLFWYLVIRPFPARPTWSAWVLVPYLLLADVQNTGLSALLAFSGQVLYPHYGQVPRLGGLSALEDQAIAGVIMWVPGSVAFLLPVGIIGVRLLFGSEVRRAGGVSPLRNQNLQGAHAPRSPGKIPLPMLPPPPARPDLLLVPLLGRFLRWRHARLVLQLPLLLLAGLIIYDGFWGPQASPLNLAGVLPWIHWRGLLIITLLTIGNVFCMGCPFVLPRRLARRWLPAGWAWPRWLRGKWPAVILLLLFFWAYEAFSLWDSPWLTACLVLAYFLGALLIDGLFRGEPFCKSVCPLGQFNFVQSLVSPLQVQVREPASCRACATKDCIRGRESIPGCETHLFVPRKVGNMDCTLCLDCLHACPHDNVGLLVTAPGTDLAVDPQRSGIGRFSRRPDLAALVLVLVFAAFSNAAGMVAPVVAWEARIRPPWLASTLFALLSLIVLPGLLVGGAAAMSRGCGAKGSGLAIATRYAFALVPLGLGMWLAHYSFHLLTSWASIGPVTQRFVADLGLPWLGEPQWSCCCCGPVPGWLVRWEIVCLDLGLLMSLGTAYRIARGIMPSPPRLCERPGRGPF